MPVAVITGASRGLGRALAQHLAHAGWALAIDARDAEALERAAEAIRTSAPGAPVAAVAGDVTDPTHRRALAATAVELGPVRLLVNNASALGPSPLPRLEALDLDAFTDVLTTNAVAPLGLVQLLAPTLRANQGTIIDISSDAAVEGYEGWGGYGASKAALDQVTRVLAAEEPDLAVYALDPGDLRTQMHQDAFPGEDISDRPLPETVLGAFDHLLTVRPPSGRYRAADLLAATSDAASPTGVEHAEPVR